MKSYRSAYNAGWNARKSNLNKDKNPYGAVKAVSRSWWLAGWNDCDMGYTQKPPE